MAAAVADCFLSPSAASQHALRMERDRVCHRVVWFEKPCSAGAQLALLRLPARGLRAAALVAAREPSGLVPGGRAARAVFGSNAAQSCAGFGCFGVLWI